MRNCCCCSVKSCCTSLLIIISYFWLFKLYLRDLHPDYRVQKIGLIKDPAFKTSADSMFLRKIDTPFIMDNFELIQMVNQTAPHTYSEEAILIISSSQNSVEGSYAHLLQKIQMSNHQADNLGYYIVRKLKNILLNVPKQIKVYTQEIKNVIEYLCKSMMVQKLTIISFEEGSLLTFKAISMIQYSVYPSISKVILINAYSPFLMIYQGNSHGFLQDLKYSILKDARRTRLLNKTRIITIDTVGRTLREKPLSLSFLTKDNKQVVFANSLMVSSRQLWNVYCYLKPDEYFKFQPFLWIIAKLFNQDRVSYQQPLSIKQIQYLLMFRQLPIKREMTIQTRAKTIKSCFAFYLEQYNLFGNVFDYECIRVIRKSDIYFNVNTTLVVKSQGKIQVYGENLQKLAPIDTKNQYSLYLFQNVHEYRKFHIINRRKRNVQILVQGIHQPNQKINQVFTSNYSVSELQTLRRREMHFYQTLQSVLLCPGFTLLFPVHFYSHYKLTSPAYSFNIEDPNGKCFKGDDYFYTWIQTLSMNWSLGANLIVFSLFCSHILKKQTFSRFYYQLMINNALVYLHTEKFYFTQNILLISIIIFIEQILNLIVLMSDFMNMPKKLASKIMWPPLVFYLLNQYDSETFLSPWKVLGLQFLAATHKENITILFLSFIYILEYVALDLPNLTHLSLICAWLTVSANETEEQYQKQQQKNNDLIIISTGKKLLSFKKMLISMRKQFANSIVLCLIAICLSEDGIVMHYIINFYIIAHVLFVIHGLFDQYIS